MGAEGVLAKRSRKLSDRELERLVEALRDKIDHRAIMERFQVSDETIRRVARAYGIGDGRKGR